MEFSVSGDIFAWVILPALIFSARVADVSLGTIRVIFISKGLKYIAPVIGFFEVIIWLLAIGQVMQNLTNVASYVAYGAGFATGTLMGMLVEERLSLGTVIIRVITRVDSAELVAKLRGRNYGVTEVDAVGSTGEVKVLLTVVRRQDAGEVIALIKQFNPHAFYSIEEVKSVREGVFPEHHGWVMFRDPWGFFRKGK
ncbi:uncharacterized protein YebE (UPF0316 family) [Methanolinea mesophila]|uniref:DUF2179 domain-containing protein n=1 Tax=Methanolinea mesophila TaxID=547055 RepID=UPI001AE51ADB|nr:uncharacterized protein YebE (UPF0316 family) [Methanolinea mesophila]